MASNTEYVVRTLLEYDTSKADAAITAADAKLASMQATASKPLDVRVTATVAPEVEKLGPLLDTTSAGAERLAHSMQLAGQANDGLGLALSRVKDGPEALASAARAEDTLAASAIRATAAHQALREAMGSEDVERIAAATQRAARAEDDLARAAMRAAAEQSAGREVGGRLGGALTVSGGGAGALARHFEPAAADAYAGALARAQSAQTQLDHVMQTGESEAGQLVTATERAAKAYGDLQHAASRASGAIEHATHAEQQASQERLAGIAQGANAASGIVGGLLSRTLQYGTMAAGMIGTAVAGGLLYGVTHLAAEAENTRLVLAGMMNASGMATSMPEGLAASAVLMEQIRRDAERLPGEERDLLNVLLGSQAGAGMTGQTETQHRQRSANFMAVTQALGVPSTEAGNDLERMYEGHIHTINASFRLMQGQIGMTAEAFNRLSDAKRVEAIDKALEKFAPMVREYEKSWAAASSTTVSHAKHLLLMASRPLLAEATRSANWLNAALTQNHAGLERLATTAGHRLAPLIERATGFADRLIERVSHMSFDQLAESADRLVHKLAAGLTLLVGMKASLGLVAGTANFLASPLGKMALARMGGGAAAGIAGAEAGGLLAGGAAAAALGTGALVGGAVVGAGAVATAGAVNAGWIGAQDMILLKDAAGLLVSGLHMLWDAVSPVVGVFGFLLVRAVEGLALGIGGLVYWIGWAADQIRGAVGGAVNWLLDHVPGLRTATNYLLMRDGPERATERGVHVPGGPTANAEAALHRAGTRLNAQKQGKMQVNVKLETTINDASDPDRVYYMVRRATQDAIRAPILSAMLPVVR